MPQNVQSRVQQQGGAVLRWFHQNRWLLMVTMFAAAVLYYPVYAYGLENLDSLCTPEPYKADLWDRIPYWETQQGRWALRLFDAAVDGMHPPFATVILTCLFMAVAAVLICDLLKLQRPVLRGISVLLLVCSQYVQNLISYRFCSAAYAASFLLAVLAVYCVAAYSCRWAVAVGALCLTFSVALYQSGLGVAAVLCLLVLIFRLLLQPEQMQSVLHLLGRMLLMGVLGMAVYLLVLQVLLKVYGVTLADINGIDQVGVQSILQLPQGIVQAYRDFVEYFTGRSITQNYYATRPACAFLFLLAGIAGVRALWQGRSHRAACVFVVVLLALVPAAANVTDIINPNTQILLRMAGAMAVVPLFAVALAATLPETSLCNVNLAGVVVVLASAFLLRGYALQSNNDIQVQKCDKQQAVSLAGQIAADVLANENHQAGTPVAVLGRPGDGVYEDPCPQYREKANLYIQWGVFWLGTQDNMDTWARLFQEELGLQVNWCSYEAAEAVRESDAYAQMPLYPQQGSIAMLDGILVVKVSA